MKHDWKEDARFVGAFVRGGNWEVGLRIARNVEIGKGNGRPSKTVYKYPVSDRISIDEFAREAGISSRTVRRYLATWEWAAGDGVVDHAVDLTAGDEYDFSEFSQDDWKEYYEVAMMNPPPWNPQGQPLDPAYGGGRNKTPTREQIKDAIRSDPKAEDAAWEAIQEKQAAKRDRFIEDRERAGVSRDVIERPIDPAWKNSTLDNLMSAAVDEAGRREVLRGLLQMAIQGRDAAQKLAADQGPTGVADEVEWLHEMSAALTDWQWAMTGMIADTVSEDER